MPAPYLRVLALSLSTLSVTFAMSAVAQPAGPTAADALFADGRAAMDRKDYAVACAKFAESDRLDPAVGTKLNLAACEKERGRVATAWGLFWSALEKLPKDDPRRSFAETEEQSIEPRVPHLRLLARGDHAEAMQVHVAGRTFGAASFGKAIPIDPGEYDVVVEVPGRAPEHAHVKLVEGGSVDLSVPLNATISDAQQNPADQHERTSGVTTATTKDAASSSGVSQRTLAFVAGGVGAVGLAVGTIAGVVALKKKAIGDDNCFDATRRCNQRGVDANASAHSFATVSTVGFIVGGVGLGVGGYLYFTGSPETHANGASAFAVNLRGVW